MLNALRDGGAVAIALAAGDRLISMEADDRSSAGGLDDEGSGDGHDDAVAGDGAPDDGFSRRDPAVALRQLAAVNEVVAGHLALEAALMRAIPGELERLREAQPDGGPGAGFIVDEVVVVEGERSADGDAPELAGEREARLVDDARLEAITMLEKAWSTARDLTEGAIRDGE